MSGEQALVHEMLIDDLREEMDCDEHQRRIFRNLHNVCPDILFDAAGFPTADPAGVDPDSFTADLGALHDAIGRQSLDHVHDLLERMSPRNI
jgi:hypothetical protein